MRNFLPGLKRYYEDIMYIVRHYNAAKNADMEEVRRLQEKVMQISATIYTVGQHGSSYLKGLKCALSLLGICSDYVAAPFHKFEQRERGKIWKALQNLGVDVVLR